jgi:superfamily II DNA or RNA helicase
MSDNLTTPIPTLQFSEGILKLEGCKNNPGNTLGIEWTWHRETSCWIADASKYRQIKKDGLNDLVPAWQQLEGLDESFLHPPRKTQSEAMAAWMVNKHGLIVLPTGGGKTEVAMHLIKNLGVSALIVAPTRDLMYQWQRRVSKGLGFQPGLVGDQHYTIKAITAATYHSACIHMRHLGNRFQMVIYDEVHHLPGEIRSDAARMCAAPCRLGLTATPPEGMRLETVKELTGPIVYEQKIDDAKGESLADFKIVPIAVDLDEEARAEYDRMGKALYLYMKSKAEESGRAYTIEHLSADSANNSEARKYHRFYHRRRAIEARAPGKMDVLEDLFLLHPTAPTIIWAADNQMARDISAQFLIPSILSHCRRPERDWVLDGFESGRFRAIVSCKLLNEGVDLPCAKVGISLGGTASKTDHTQKLGRILRRTGGVAAIYYEVFLANSSDETRSKARRPAAPKKAKKTKTEEGPLLC